MAKDRFSNQKGANWNPTLRYSADSYYVNKYVAKRNLDIKTFNKISGLCKLPLNEWETSFVKSILQWKKELTIKQEKTIKNIITKYKPANKQAIT